jgi:predicted permease
VPQEFEMRVTEDLGSAWCALRRDPWYWGAATLVVAAGISLAAHTVAIVDGVLFKPLPYPRAHELYLIKPTRKASPRSVASGVSWMEILAWRAAIPEVTIGVAQTTTRRLSELAAIDYLETRVDKHFFDVLEVEPLIGGFTPEDLDRPNQGGLIQPRLITYRFWHVIHGADPGVVGQVIGEPNDRNTWVRPRIAGVLQPEFLFPSAPGQAQPEILSPLPRPRAVRHSPEDRTLQAFVRIPAGRDVLAVQARLSIATVELAKGMTSEDEPFDDATLVSLATYLGGGERPVFRALLGGAALLVLLTCLNVGGLTAARAASRHRELGVRLALGASRWRLARYQMTELTMLLLPASALGLALVPAALRISHQLAPSTLVLLKTPAVDGRVLLIAGGIVAGSIVLASVWPLLRLRRLDAASALAGRMEDGRTNVRTTRWLVVSQAAVGFVLLIAGTLASGSLAAALGEETGYARRNLAVLHVFTKDHADYLDARAQLLTTWERLRAIPGVSGVAMSGMQPMFESSQARAFTMWAPSHAPDDTGDVSSRPVSSNYFDVMRLDLITGSLPDESIWNADGPVAVISESAATRWWPRQSAIGQTLVTAAADFPRRPMPPKTVVAVVRDARYVALDQTPLAEVYVPGPFSPTTVGGYFLLRTSLAAESLIPAMLAVAEQENLQVSQATSFEAALFKSIRRRALLAWLLGLPAAAAVLIVATGVLGLVALTVAHRVRELGVRIALGATSAGLVGLLLTEQLRAVAGGIAVGALIAVWAAQILASQLYGVSPFQWSIWFVTATALLLVAGLGTLVPAVRIVASDPVRSLRRE